jgi:hypothetical protein
VELALGTYNRALKLQKAKDVSGALRLYESLLEQDILIEELDYQPVFL